MAYNDLAMSRLRRRHGKRSDHITRPLRKKLFERPQLSRSVSIAKLAQRTSALKKTEREHHWNEHHQRPHDRVAEHLLPELSIEEQLRSLVSNNEPSPECEQFWHEPPEPQLPLMVAMEENQAETQNADDHERDVRFPSGSTEAVDAASPPADSTKDQRNNEGYEEHQNSASHWIS